MRVSRFDDAKKIGRPLSKKKNALQHSYKKKKRCCPPFTNAHKLTAEGYEHPAVFVSVPSDS